jgi:hypothetical protein
MQFNQQTNEVTLLISPVVFAVHWQYFFIVMSENAESLTYFVLVVIDSEGELPHLKTAAHDLELRRRSISILHSFAACLRPNR